MMPKPRNPDEKIITRFLSKRERQFLLKKLKKDYKK